MTVTFYLQSLYFMLPAYFGNMSPVLLKKTFKSLAKPIDNGKTFRGKRLFGKNKTWRGIILSSVIGIATALMQKLIGINSLVDYAGMSWIRILGVGFLLGFGAIAGDFTKSFFKRQVGIQPGAIFFPFDQIDFTIGALVFVSFVFIAPWQAWVFIVLFSIILHISSNHIAYWLGIRKEKW